jgi:hypothetical protein
MKRKITTIFVVTAVAAVLILAGKTLSQDSTAASETQSGEQWEYLVVSGSSSNLTPSGNPNMRKEPGPFGREAFVLEQNLDKLGAKGWQLVVVSGPQNDPVFYFKRRK